MLGAIAGDIIGSIYESSPIRTKDFAFFAGDCRFTDDTVCSVAVADCIMSGGDFGDFLSSYALRHPKRGYGGMFSRWAKAWERQPYGSFGNGAAMRVSAIPYLGRSEEEVLQLAEQSSLPTHNHPDAIHGARAIAWVMWRALKGEDPAAIRHAAAEKFHYDLTPTVDDFRTKRIPDATCKGTVPAAIVCALEAKSYQEAVRNAVSLGVDSDTMACISGGIAEAAFGMADEIAGRAFDYLTPTLAKAVDRFVEHQPPHLRRITLTRP